MADENANTADLAIDEKLDRILQRLAALEAQGANTTRPLLNQIIQEIIQTRDTLPARMDDVEVRLDRIESRLETLVMDVVDVRAAQRRLTERQQSDEQRGPKPDDSCHLFLPQFAFIGARADGSEVIARAREYTRD